MLRTTLLCIALALPLAAAAQSRDKLVQEYSGFAGSEANAKSLVDGLRTGSEVKLSDGKTTTTFTPQTGKMGNGNVNIALALAEADLKKQGITNPTPTQIKTEMSKILAARADNKGWGQIAQSMGFKLGEVMRSEKAAAAIEKADRQERHARADRAERAAKLERVERPEKPGRPEKPERPGRN